MLIATNESNFINDQNDEIINYDELYKRAYDTGLDGSKGIAIDVNILKVDVFEDFKSIDGVIYFTLNGTIPDFIDGVDVQDWSSRVQDEDPEAAITISNLIDDSIYGDDYSASSNQKEAKIYVFGSSKGGTGKTFTSIISTYRYAKTHPHQHIALIDFDIIDGQVGISIHKVRPTIARYYTEYQKGYRDFKTMQNFAVKGNNVFPQNVDFYLAPSNGSSINNNDFWFNIIENAISNYDVVVFDTGIDYLNIVPISYAYKIADKINLITTTSIKSVNSVIKQVERLKGEIKSPGKDENGNQTNYVFTKDDDIESKLNIIITQMTNDINKMNKTIYRQLSEKANVLATFGVITDRVGKAEFYGEWNVFDDERERVNKQINEFLDKIME